MNVKFVHCLFEQSGTFKREFKKLGIGALDYDIEDNFQETDLNKDLFAEIRQAYYGYSSIFDLFDKDEDLVFAFFPCIRFSKLFLMCLNCTANKQSQWPDEKKLEYSMEKMSEVESYYRLVSQLVIVCLRKGLRLIIENPYSRDHFLTRYFPVKPAVIDMDRSKFGDYFRKPTQYWFFNCKPENHIDFGGNLLDNKPTKKVIECSNHFERSIIASTYAEWFIKEFILDGVA